MTENLDADKEKEGTTTQRRTVSSLTLIAGDIDILKMVYEFRFLRREQLSALTGRPMKRLHRRILRLVKEGYLTSIRLPQRKHIYGLGRAGLVVLVEHGIGGEDLLATRLRTHELKELFLKHEMMIVDIHLALKVASRPGLQNLVGWQEGSELFDSVTAREGGRTVKLPIRPDAFFSLGDQRQTAEVSRTHFFLEADRSTTTQARFQEKLRAYWQYLEQGLHTKKHGIKSFRVLTVTLTDERATNLARLAGSTLPGWARKYFLFASVKYFTPGAADRVFSAVCVSARGTEKVSLAPAPFEN